MAVAQTDFASDATQLLRALKAIQDGFDAMVKKINQTEAESKKVASATDKIYAGIGSGAKTAVRDLAAIATGWLTIGTAVRIATAEVDKYHARNAMAADVGTRFNRGISAAMQNAPAQFNRPQVEQIAIGAAKTAGVQPDFVSTALGPTFAAGTGSLGAGQISGLMAAGAAISPGNQEDYTAIASGAVSFASLLPGGQNVSPQQLYGFLIGASRETAVDRLQFYVPEAAKVAAGARSYSLDVPECIAIFNAISRGIKDETGELSRTQTLNILKSLANVRDKNKLKTNSPKEILAFILGKPSLARRVVEDMNTRAPTEGFVGSIFKQGGIGNQFLGDAFSNTPTMAGAEGVYAAQVQRMGGSSLSAAERTAQAINSTADIGLLSNPQQMELGMVRPAFERFLQAGGGSALGDSAEKLLFDIKAGLGGKDPTDYLRGPLAAREKALRSPTTYNYGPEGGGMFEMPASQESVQQADLIRQLLLTLSSIDQRMAATAAQTPVSANGDRPAMPFDPFGIGQRIYNTLGGGGDLPHAKPGAY